MNPQKSKNLILKFRVFKLFTKLLMLCLGFYLMTPSYAQEIVELRILGKSEQKSRTAARQEIFDNAIRQASMKYIRELIGSDKASKNGRVIENQILKNSKKYVLSIKAGEFQTSEAGSEMNVDMRLSTKAIRDLLLEAGLLYRLSGPPKVLPMLVFKDRVNAGNFVWWTQEVSDTNRWMSESMTRLHRDLKKAFIENGFYLHSPILSNARGIVPSVLSSERPPTEDYLLLAEVMSSQIVLRGDVEVAAAKASDRYQLNFRVSALQSSNGRVIAEIVRTFETDPGSLQLVVNKKLEDIGSGLGEDLRVQLYEAWKSGTFGANLVQLAVNSELSYKVLGDFKKAVLANVKDIKTMKERLFEPGRVIFEIDSSAAIQTLAKVIQSKTFPGFEVKVANINDGSIELNVNAQ